MDSKKSSRTKTSDDAQTCGTDETFATSKSSLLCSFRFAASGIVDTAKNGRNFKIQLVAAVLALLISYILKISCLEFAIIIICIGVVLSAECLNTAIEKVVDLLSPNYSELAKTAKDCSAGFVLILAVSALFVGILIFGKSLLTII